MRKFAGILLLFITLLGVSSKMNAQYYVLIPTYTNRFRFSAEAGVNLSKIGENYGGSDFKLGYFGGLKADFKLSQQLPFYIESGVKFTTKGLKGELNETSGNVDIDAQYVQIPLTFMYTFRFREDLSFSVRLGPYVAFGVGGKTKMMIKNQEGNIVEKSMDTFGTNPIVEKTDFGIAAGGALNINKVSVFGTYEHGFNDAVKFGDTRNVRGIAIGIAFYYH